MPQVIRSFAARSYLLFFAVLVTTALLLGTTDSFSASSLKVISPNGGQTYAVGQSVKIKWAKGNGGTKVKVTLLKGGKGYLVITKKTANDGKLTWKIPSKVKAGGNYKIKIQSLSDTKVSDISNKPFKITKAKDTKAKDTKTATFKVTQPKRGKKYKTGKKMAIRWNKGTGTYVKITLLKGTKTYKVIHKKTKNDGKHTYTIPTSIKAGKAYKIKICSTKSTKSCATSKAFTIAKGTATTIKVTYPNKKEELEQGSTHVIKWNKGNGGKFVKIQLTRVKAGKDKAFRFLAKKTKNDGKFSWKIPTTNKYPVASKYKIKVMAFKGGAKINDLSDKTFSIVKASSGGSTGGGNTGGGSTGGGSTGGGSTGGDAGGGTGKDPCVGEGAAECEDLDAGGGGQDDNEPDTDVGGEAGSTIRITSPTNGQMFETGVTFEIAWTATGAAAGNDVCIAISNTVNGQFHGKYDGQFKTKVSNGKVTAKFTKALPIDPYTVHLGVRKKGRQCLRGIAQGKPSDHVVILHVAPIPVATICGNGVVEGVEVCDHGAFNGVADAYRCGAPYGDSTKYRSNAVGTFSQFSRIGISCSQFCAAEMEHGLYRRGGAGGWVDWYYHDAEAVNINGLLSGVAGNTPGEDGYRICTPE